MARQVRPLLPGREADLGSHRVSDQAPGRGRSSLGVGRPAAARRFRAAAAPRSAERRDASLPSRDRRTDVRGVGAARSPPSIRPLKCGRQVSPICEAAKPEKRNRPSATSIRSVYEAERPELFFKAPGWRVAGHAMPIRIRRDSRWNVPEPELTLVINARGEIVGFCAGNDVSSRDIEGENPLYLPQAKIYDGSCALGPGISLCEADTLGNLSIDLAVTRDGHAIFAGETRTSQLKRPLQELVDYLRKELDFPDGVFLMTGTGIVPPDDFSLAARRPRPHHHRRSDARKRSRPLMDLERIARHRRALRDHAHQGARTGRPPPDHARDAARGAERQPLRHDAGRRHGMEPCRREQTAGPDRQHAGRPARRRRTAGRAGIPHRTLGDRAAGQGSGRNAARGGRGAVRRATAAIRATGARRAPPGCSTACRIATTPRSRCGV